MPKLLIFDAFMLLIPEKTVANYALLQCKTFSSKIWVCKIFDKFHVWVALKLAIKILMLAISSGVKSIPRSQSPPSSLEAP